MKTTIRMILSLLLLTMVFSAVGCSKVPAGHKGVKVYLLGGSKGVEAEELGVGRYWIGWNEELYLFPTFTQNAIWTADEREGSPTNESIEFQTREGMAVSADIGISYSINPEMVSEIFQKYRKGVDEITAIVIRNAVRDAFVKFSATKPVEYVYGAGKAELLADVQKYVSDYFKPIGIDIEKISLVGQFRLPGAVTTALNAKIEATQRAQQRENEVQEAKAEAAKKVAQAVGEAESLLTVAKGQAEANRILTASISPALIDYKRVEKWDGILPKVTGGATPMIPFDMK